MPAEEGRAGDRAANIDSGWAFENCTAHFHASLPLHHFFSLAGSDQCFFLCRAISKTIFSRLARRSTSQGSRCLKLLLMGLLMKLRSVAQSDQNSAFWAEKHNIFVYCTFMIVPDWSGQASANKGTSGTSHRCIFPPLVVSLCYTCPHIQICRHGFAVR